MFDEAEFFEYPDDITGKIELPPSKTMKSRAWKCMMIIMPTFTHGKNADKEIIL